MTRTGWYVAFVMAVLVIVDAGIGAYGLAEERARHQTHAVVLQARVMALEMTLDLVLCHP